MEDVAALRRDKLTGIIARAHGRLQAVMVDAGIDPAIARMVAAARVYQLLPTTIRQQLTGAEAEIATRMALLFRDVAKAAEGDAVRAIPDQ